MTEIAARTARPDRIIGLHFLHPVPIVPLVEVVRGLSTWDQTFRTALELVRLLGKTGIEVFEYPGYVTTRDGRLLLFSTIANNHVVANREVERVQDALLAFLAGATIGAR